MYANPYVKDTKFTDKIIEIIKAEKVRVADQLAGRIADAQELVANDNGPREVQFDDESGEGAGAAVDREFHLMQAATLQDELEEFDAALSRIKSKRYGMCEKCHKPIPKARLETVPAARICAPCGKPSLDWRF